MKIGIFDSGLGGLIVAKAIKQKMPEYDYVYLGDTKRVPYGNRSHQTVYGFTKQGVEYLFKKENCAIVIVACNTASARALRKIQFDYKNTNKKILGVLIPTAEEAAKYERVGVLATLGTVASKTFLIEMKKVNKKVKVFQNPAPMLVPLIEGGENKLVLPFLKNYLKPLINKGIDALVLGCTHYPILKKEIRKIIPQNIKIISQDEIIPSKLKEYFKRHKEIESKISRKGKAKILVTDVTQTISKLSKKWFGNVKPRLVKI
jgi:glutamate racemase